jgi:hypothetical protein
VHFCSSNTVITFQYINHLFVDITCLSISGIPIVNIDLNVLPNLKMPNDIESLCKFGAQVVHLDLRKLGCQGLQMKKTRWGADRMTRECIRLRVPLFFQFLEMLADLSFSCEGSKMGPTWRARLCPKGCGIRCKCAKMMRRFRAHAALRWPWQNYKSQTFHLPTIVI